MPYKRTDAPSIGHDDCCGVPGSVAHSFQKPAAPEAAHFSVPRTGYVALEGARGWLRLRQTSGGIVVMVRVAGHFASANVGLTIKFALDTV